MGQQTIQTDRRAVQVPAADDRLAALRANAEAFRAAGQLIRDGFQAAQARVEAEFKPTRQELRRVQYLAQECEIDARATAFLGALGTRSWYGMHRPAQRAAEAFSLSAKVASRGAL